ETVFEPPSRLCRLRVGQGSFRVVLCPHPLVSSLGISGLSAPTLPRWGRYSAPLAGTGGTGRPDLACSRWEVEPDRAIVEEERGPAPTSAPASVCVSREAVSSRSLSRR